MTRIETPEEFAIRRTLEIGKSLGVVWPHESDNAVRSDMTEPRAPYLISLINKIFNAIKR